ncbi:MAG: DUF5103 domain-containing protein [Prevotellaceae bacterium]|jgi:hypothetical protein|nr:DUF5103 domain-containing protein [Prevotellaceae bacterium]
MKKPITIFTLSIIAILGVAKNYQTQIFNPEVKTLQIYPVNKPLELPVIELNTNEKLSISFDEMHYGHKNFYYKIIHCNKDFSPSVLSEIEYINGFYYGSIDEVNLSVNTVTNYANYRFEIPDDNFAFKVSGNYAVIIAEDNDFSRPAATAVFYVCESQVKVAASTTSHTDIEFNGRYQQLDFIIDNTGYKVQNAFAEIDVNVFQNRRKDNAVLNLKPTFTSLNKQTYTKNKNLIFEGGNQYRIIDFPSEYAFSGEIDKIEIKADYYNVFLYPATPRNNSSSPTSGLDVDGLFIIHRKNNDYDNFTPDYMWVHFLLPAKTPFKDCEIHIMGELTNNVFNENSKMDYDTDLGIYHKTLMLKQGGYGFMYAFLPKNKNTATLQTFEGSYWQTQNEYTIMVYHRPFGGRYDKLIGVEVLNN